MARIFAIIALCVLIIGCAGNKDNNMPQTPGKALSENEMMPLVLTGSNFNMLTLRVPATDELVQIFNPSDSIVYYPDHPMTFEITMQAGNPTEFCNPNLTGAGGARIDGTESFSFNFVMCDTTFMRQLGPHTLIYVMRDLRKDKMVQ